MSRGFISDFFGWASIACWLFAQFPQVLENIRRQSCEGLALPFLLNWLLGDVTNLIGCVLTHQLPFQTILASYFVSVDFMLFSQFFYYKPSPPKPEVIPGPSSHIYNSHRRHISELNSHAHPIMDSEQEIRSRSNTLSPVRPIHRRSSTSITRSEELEAEDEVDEGALAALTESFHSELGRKHVSWSQERFGHRNSTSRTRTFPDFTSLAPIHTTLPAGFGEGTETPIPTDRGRRREKQITESPLDVVDLEEQNVSRRTGSLSLARERRSSRASHQSLGLVFLGIWALVSIGQFSGTSRMDNKPTGIVLSTVTTETPIPAIVSVPAINPISYGGDNEIKVIAAAPTMTSQAEQANSEITISWSERVVGRMFAWMCTLLYLTSRLPQILKNYRRKSVEGLSMYLFVFAFLGNTFYVLSILSSPMMAQPRPAANAFLVESTPYLLGSGGTLLFDVTIVTQSFLYRPRCVPSNTHSSFRSHTRTNSKSSDPGNDNQNDNHVSDHRSIPSTGGRYAGVARVSEEEQTLLGSSSPRLGSRLNAAGADLEHGYEYGYGHGRDPRGTGTRGTSSRRRKDTYSSDTSVLDESTF